MCHTHRATQGKLTQPTALSSLPVCPPAALVLRPFSLLRLSLFTLLISPASGLHTPGSKTSQALSAEPWQPTLKPMKEVVPGRKLWVINNRNPTPAGTSKSETLHAYISFRKG